MKTAVMISFLISSPIFWKFNGTLAQWIGTALALIFMIYAIKMIRQRRMRVMDQYQPRYGHRTYTPGGPGWDPSNYNMPNQQAPIMVIAPPNYNQQGVQNSNQPPPVWHDLPLERYELL